MITITLTPQEKDGLLQLLDLATKAGGLNVAGNALFFAKKIQDAATPAEDTFEQQLAAAKAETAQLKSCNEKS